MRDKAAQGFGGGGLKEDEWLCVWSSHIHKFFLKRKYLHHCWFDSQLHRLQKGAGPILSGGSAVSLGVVAYVPGNCAWSMIRDDRTVHVKKVDEAECGDFLE